MNNFLKRKSIVSQDSSLIQETCASDHSSKQNRIDFITLFTGPGLRKKKKKKKISEYHPKDQDEIRRAYMQKSLYQQPLSHKFCKRTMVRCCVDLTMN
jgi:hypothetical protein